MEEHILTEAEEEPRRRWWVVALWVVGAIVALLGGAALAGTLYVKHLLSPPAARQAVAVAIPPGTDSAGIASILEKQGLIRNHTAFVYYVKYIGEGSHFQAGDYEMTPGMTIRQIVDKLNAGDTVKRETIRFTIPEGYTLKQIADKLGGAGIVNADSFLKLADSAKLPFVSPWLADIPVDGGLSHKLEGYLFPETYEMAKGSSELDILQRMVAEWDRKTAALPSDWKDQMTKLGLDFHRLLTVASLIEREVVVDEERPVVAGVIYNRLSRKMPLQIDATVQYALGATKERLLEKDLQVKSPYNTYLNAGLPPGPIASVGLASIRAALYPAQTKYLYYVTKKDGTQTHLFAETLDQHNRNIEASKKQSKP